ncbi:MAG: hypothetical protein A2029_01460 [Chloroflexi bacterium RBG_19FT_COMBO_47_9]|nr:MAG: hypothetical protein A2W25_05005 [candidate division Zixibacteria bacterium RBG_16_53_22]OGO66574.1 MAG: hypothetical protein A2029_01460 [Chloroflexi bacterium RBG_19FT_COMBO_47_9]
MNISEIVSKYRGEKSLREFAIDLSDHLPEPISYQSIKNWEDGIKPSYYTILAIFITYDDWRGAFALEILRVLKPELYKPDPIKSV